MFSDQDSDSPCCREQQSAESLRGWACSNCGFSYPRPLAVSVKEFCRLVGCGKTTAWCLEREGKIETRKVRGRKVVLTRSINALLQL